MDIVERHLRKSGVRDEEEKSEECGMFTCVMEECGRTSCIYDRRMARGIEL